MLLCVSIEHESKLESRTSDDQQQLQQELDEMRQKIDNLNRQHAESLEIEHTTIRLNHDLLIEQLRLKNQQEIEEIHQGVSKCVECSSQLNCNCR